MSSTCRSPATPATGPRAGTTRSLYAFENDVVVVAAAGNRGSGTSEVGAPATIPGVLTVAGVDKEKKASFDATLAGHHDRGRRPERRPRRRASRWAGRDLERHERCGAARLGPRRARALRVPRPRRRERDRAGHPDGRPERARGAERDLRIRAHRRRRGARRPTSRRVDENPLGSLAEWITPAPAARRETPVRRLRRRDRADRRPAASRAMTRRTRCSRRRGPSPISRSRSRLSLDLVR